MKEPQEPQGPLPERRAETAVLLTMVQTIHDNLGSLHSDVRTLNSDVNGLNGRLSAHMLDETHDLAEEVSKLMVSAFPDGDPDGHRRHHEAVLAKAEARAAFWKKMFFELCKYGLIGFMGWLALTAWNAFLQGPHK